MSFSFSSRRLQWSSNFPLGVFAQKRNLANPRFLRMLADIPRFNRIAALIDTWRPERLVVGLALDTDGSDQYATNRCRRFANQLQGRYRLPVELVDERGSSVQAQRIAGNAHDDAVAAAIILQRYFDATT